MSTPNPSTRDQVAPASREAERLAALRALEVLDTPREATFDDLTALVADICQTPMAMISLVDESRQWFKSAVGLTEKQTSRKVAFCAHALDKPDLLLVPDATQDPRFADNPLVKGDSHIRFYAGAPLVTPEGHALGALCVLDRVPRQLNERQQTALRVLSRQVMTELQLRHRLREHAKVEQALRQSEAVQSELVRGLEAQRARLVEAQAVAKIGSWETDLATLTVIWSEETHRIFETDPRTFAPTHPLFLDRVHPDDRAAVDQAFQLSVSSRETQAIEHRLLLPDGRIKFITERWQVFRDEADRPVRATGTCQDITERKQAERRFAEAQRFNLTLIEASPLAIIAYRASGEGVAANAASMRMLGAPNVEAVQRQNFRQIAAWRDSGLLKAADETLARGQPQEREIHLRNSFGKDIWLHCRLIPLTYAGEDYLLGFFDDIQERKRAEMERDRLFNLSLDLLCVAGFDGRLQQVNPAWTECLGWTAEELTSRPMLDFVHPDDCEATLRTRAQIQRGQPVRNFENRYRGKDGAYRWFSWNVHPLPESQQVFAVARDVTAARTNEERLRLLDVSVAHLNDLVVITEMEPLAEPGPRIVYVNDAFERLTGYTRAETIGRSPRFLQGPKTDRGALDRIRAALQKRQPVREEIINYSKSGREYWLEMEIVPVTDAAGGVTHAIAVERDITGRKAAEAKIHREESLMELASKIAKVAGWTVTVPDFKLYWSRQVWGMVDYPKEKEPGLNELLHYYLPGSRTKLIKAIMRCAKAGQPFDLELELVTPAGRRLWVRVAAEADRDPAGRIQAVHGAFSDITDQKRSERELLRTNRALQMLSNSNEVLIRAENEKELLQEICRIAVEHGGYRMAWVGYAEQDEARTIRPIAHAGVEEGYLGASKFSWREDDPSGQGPGGRVIRSGQPLVCEDVTQETMFAPWQPLAQQHGYRGVICLPLCEQDRTFGLLALYTAEVVQTGAEELTLLRELADDLAFGIVNLRARLDRRRTQEAVLAMARGISASIGAEFFDRLTHSVVGALGAHAGFIAQFGPGDPGLVHSISAVVAGKTVPNFDYHLAGSPCEHLDQAEVWVVPRDAWRLYPQATSLAAMGIEAYVGVKLASAAGRPLGLLVLKFKQPLEQPEFVLSILKIFASRAAAELERANAESKTREQAALLDQTRDAILVRDTEDRITFWNHGAERLYGWTAAEALGRTVAELIKPEPAKFHEALGIVHREGAWMGEIQKTGRNGTTLIIDGRWTLLRDAAGRPKSILAIDTDITERKKLEQQFLRAQRMESIGTLAGGIAHDLNNLLAPITMGVDLLKLFDPSPRSLPVIENIERSAKRGADLVQQVLSFARGVEGARVALQVRHILKEIESISTNTFPKNIVIETHVPADLWLIQADPTQLNQVILNLCVNARDAMPDGGRLELTAANVEIDEQYAAMKRDAPPGRYVVIQVTDTGHGMPPEVIDRIFEPFFTTKELGKGTGLGLSTVLGIVRSHAGFVNVYSEVGRGSTFKVHLPVAAGGAAESATPAEETLPRGNDELILVVDDETSILDITKQTLRAFGYRVMTAEDGAHAIGLYAQHRDEIAVVLTDMMMPVMDGPALIIALRRINPAVRLIAASGLAANSNMTRAAGAGVKHFLAKPYSADALLTVVREVLRDGGTRPPL